MKLVQNNYEANMHFLLKSVPVREAAGCPVKLPRMAISFLLMWCQSPGLGLRQLWVQILALLPPSCVTLDTAPNPRVQWFLYLQDGA